MEDSKFKYTAVKIGDAVARLNRTALNVARVGVGSKKELAAISQEIKALKQQLQKNTEGPA